MDAAPPGDALLFPDDPLSRIDPPVAIDDRLTVRHRLDDGSATDVIGWVCAIDTAEITVLSGIDESGEHRQRVDRDRIILAKRVPPARGSRPLSRVSAEELERAAVPGWIADSEPLGGWTLRSGRGFSGRANSCLAVGDPGLPYSEAADSMINFYRSVELPPKAQVIVGSEAEQALRDLGWSDSYVTTTVMVQPLTDLLHDQQRDASIKITSELTDHWWQAYLRYRPVPDHAIARRILAGPPPVGLASIAVDDHIVAVGRGQVSGEWLGVAALWTDQDHRRLGLATRIMIELGHWAARYGARAVYLQVAQQNTGAIAAYERLGFARHHDYLYLSPPE
jgi:GNAT superfamily N-acetyltransferase